MGPPVTGKRVSITGVVAPEPPLRSCPAVPSGRAVRSWRETGCRRPITTRSFRSCRNATATADSWVTDVLPHDAAGAVRARMERGITEIKAVLEAARPMNDDRHSNGCSTESDSTPLYSEKCAESDHCGRVTTRPAPTRGANGAPAELSGPRGLPAGACPEWPRRKREEPKWPVVLTLMWSRTRRRRRGLVALEFTEGVEHADGHLDRFGTAVVRDGEFGDGGSLSPGLRSPLEILVRISAMICW